MRQVRHLGPVHLAIHSQARQPSENGGLDLRVLGRRQRRDAQPSRYCRWATLLREGRVSLALLRHLGRSFGCRGRRSRKVTKPPKGPVVPKRLPHRAKPTQGRGPSSCWACQAVSHAFPTTSWSSAPFMQPLPPPLSPYPQIFNPLRSYAHPRSAPIMAMSPQKEKQIGVGESSPTSVFAPTSTLPPRKNLPKAYDNLPSSPTSMGIGFDMHHRAVSEQHSPNMPCRHVSCAKTLALVR